MTYQCRFISANKCAILVQDADSGEVVSMGWGAYEQFHVHSKIEHKVQIMPVYKMYPSLLPSPSTSSIKVLHIFVIDEPTMTHHDHLKSIVYIRIHY